MPARMHLKNFDLIFLCRFICAEKKISILNGFLFGFGDSMRRFFFNENSNLNRRRWFPLHRMHRFNRMRIVKSSFTVAKHICHLQNRRDPSVDCTRSDWDSLIVRERVDQSNTSNTSQHIQKSVFTFPNLNYNNWLIEFLLNWRLNKLITFFFADETIKISITRNCSLYLHSVHIPQQ